MTLFTYKLYKDGKIYELTSAAVHKTHNPPTSSLLSGQNVVRQVNLHKDLSLCIIPPYQT